MRNHQLLASLFAPTVLLATACGGRSDLNDFKNGVGIPSLTEGDGGGAPQADSGTDAGGAPEEDAGTPNDDAGASDGGQDDAGQPATDGGPAQPGAIGGACEENGDCAGDATCLTTLGDGMNFEFAFPDGYCTQLECENDGDCPSGSSCFSVDIPFGGFEIPSACVDECETEGDCREGYECSEPPLGGDGRTFCLPPFDFGGFPFPGGG